MEKNSTIIDIFFTLIKEPNKAIQAISVTNKNKQLLLCYFIVFGFLGFIYPFLERDLISVGFEESGQEYTRDVAIQLGIMFTWLVPFLMGIAAIIYCGLFHIFATFLMKGKGKFSKTIITFLTITTLIQGIQIPITVIVQNIPTTINIIISIFFLAWSFILHYKLIRHNYELLPNNFYIGTFQLSLSLRSCAVLILATLAMLSIGLMFLGRVS
mgnify:CR=1 FL=1